MKVTLIEKRCKCGEVISCKTIDIKAFKQGMFKVDEKAIKAWTDGKHKLKTCWRCGKLPEIGEVWGLSLNNGERNRLFCEKCGVFVADQLTMKKGENGCIQ